MFMSQAEAKPALSVPDEYSTLAYSYERRWQQYLEVSTAHTLTALDLQDGERVLDAGCGTGLLLRRIAARVPKACLVGVDLTPAMIRRADAALSLLAVADVRHLPLTDESFDAVVIESMVQYLPALAPVLSEASRVVRPGGRVVITAWDGDSWPMQMLGRWLRWRNGTDVRLYRRRDFIVECHYQGLSLQREESYPVGRFWRLLTLVAGKNVGEGD